MSSCDPGGTCPVCNEVEEEDRLFWEKDDRDLVQHDDCPYCPPVKPMWYVAHPVSGDIAANVANVLVWLRWLRENDPSRVYVAPWVAEVMAYQGHEEEITPEFYDAVLADDCAVVRHCDGILLVGGKVSRGMAIERDAALTEGLEVRDLSHLRTPEDGLVEALAVCA